MLTVLDIVPYLLTKWIAILYIPLIMFIIGIILVTKRNTSYKCRLCGFEFEKKN